MRQDVEAYVPNAEYFYVAFDAASNATMGMGKVALQEFDARDPTVFYPRYRYVCTALARTVRFMFTYSSVPFKNTIGRVAAL